MYTCISISISEVISGRGFHLKHKQVVVLAVFELVARSIQRNPECVRYEAPAIHIMKRLREREWEKDLEREIHGERERERESVRERVGERVRERARPCTLSSTCHTGVPCL